MSQNKGFVLNHLLNINTDLLRKYAEGLCIKMESKSHCVRPTSSLTSSDCNNGINADRSASFPAVSLEGLYYGRAHMKK